MAYITTERVAEIRKELKATFPTFKFSVTRRHHSTVAIAILAADFDFMVGENESRNYLNINTSWIGEHYKDQPAKRDLLQKISDIAHVGYYNNSDPMSDYFDYAFYVDLTVGTWEKTFIFTGVVPTAPVEVVVNDPCALRVIDTLPEAPAELPKECTIGMEFQTSNAKFTVIAVKQQSLQNLNKSETMVTNEGDIVSACATSKNTYSKYFPNVFLAKCSQPYESGQEITVTTKYGKENECVVHNLIYEKDGYYYYSITRADGFNSQQRALNRAEKLNGYAANAEKRANNWHEKSNEGRDFLALGEPIKIGHHSEKRHRALIQRNWDRMGNSVKESEKAEEYQQRAEYWESKANKIDLSMPESVGYYGFLLEQNKERHEGLKSGKYPREHSYSLTYAKKELNETEKLFEIAQKLWA
jgi:hypothetical protein